MRVKICKRQHEYTGSLQMKLNIRQLCFQFVFLQKLSQYKRYRATSTSWNSSFGTAKTETGGNIDIDEPGIACEACQALQIFFTAAAPFISVSFKGATRKIPYRSIVAVVVRLFDDIPKQGGPPSRLPTMLYIR